MGRITLISLCFRIFKDILLILEYPSHIYCLSLWKYMILQSFKEVLKNLQKFPDNAHCSTDPYNDQRFLLTFILSSTEVLTNICF